MGITEIKINENARIIIRDGYFKVLFLENYDKDRASIRKIIADNRIKFITLSGYIANDILDGFADILSIRAFSNQKLPIDGLYQLTTLQSIEIENSFNMPIDFSKFKKLEDLEVQWNPYLKFDGANSMKWLQLRKYGGEEFNLSLPVNLEYLLLTQGKLKNISGIEKVKSIRALEIAYLPKMEDYCAIGKLKELEYLQITNCRRVGNIDFIKSLKNLKWVCFSGCKEIDSLKPLYFLKNLEGIHLTDTKILDNDKSIVKEKSNYKAYPYSRVIQRLYKDI